MSVRQTFCLFLTLVFCCGTLAYSEPQQATSIPFAKSALDSGQRWWCAKNGSCDRERDDCNGSSVGGCRSQASAYAYSSKSPKDSFAAVSLVYASKAHCEENRAFSIEDGNRVSKCVVVGAKAAPPRKRAVLPRGRGFYCSRYTVGGQPSSSCGREEDGCVRALGVVTMLEPSAAVQSECGQRRSAWASEKEEPEGAFFMISETKVDCETLRTQLGGTRCKQVW